MVKDIERLHGKRERNALCELRFLGKREIDLPVRQGTNHSIRLVAKPDEISIRISGRGLKCGGVDVRHAWNIPRSRMLVWQRQWHSRNDVGTLVGLIIAVWKNVSIGKSGERRIRVRGNDIVNRVAEVHEYG